ncbi:MAG: energy transducer TonB [Burkholderiales bacterium]
MNGRSQRAYFSFPQPAGLSELLSPAATRKRLAGAIVLSLLLHAGALVMHSPGTGAGAQAVRAAPRALEIRMERGEPPAPKAEVAPAAVSAIPPPPSEPARPEGRLSRGLDLLPVPADPYFTTDRLTKQPLATSQPSLFVPRQTARYVSGRVVLKLWINEFGAVDEVEVERSDLPETVSSIAAAAFRKLQFVPGEVDGRPVGVLMRVEIAYVDGRVAFP